MVALGSVLRSGSLTRRHVGSVFGLTNGFFSYSTPAQLLCTCRRQCQNKTMRMHILLRLACGAALCEAFAGTASAARNALSNKRTLSTSVLRAVPVVVNTDSSSMPTSPGFLPTSSSLDTPIIERDGHYLDTQAMPYREPNTSPLENFLLALKMRLQLRGRIPSGKILSITLSGGLNLASQQRFGTDAKTLTGLCAALLNAAHDPRIDAVLMIIEVRVGMHTPCTRVIC
jgi:hypothetical protein